jgi:predicted Rossmann-fold nucleotide-binding protein
VGSAYWSGLLDWPKTTMLAEGKIGPDELTLLRIADDPADVVKISGRRGHPAPLDRLPPPLTIPA